jgi:hypothetical protein
MKARRPEVSFEHAVAALERELLEATDEEVFAAAAELGMNPSIKGSAAFFGVKSPLLRVRSPQGSRSSAKRSPRRLSRRERSGPGDS